MGSVSVTTSIGQYLVSPKVLQLKEVEIPEPGEHEVQIAPLSVTLCGSDLHYYNHGRNGSITVKEPLCLGHECAGEIVQVGSNVRGLDVGDRVAVECGVPCSNCEHCEENRYNLCPKLRFRSSGSAFPHFQGTLQTRINHPAQWVHRLPDSLDFDDGALLEPLAVACHAARRAMTDASTTCLVMGAGAIGLLCASAARSRGCNRIIICDVDKRRVDFAVAEGFADVGWVSVPQKSATVEEGMEHSRKLASEIGAQVWPDGSQVRKLHVVFECTGVPACVQTSIYAARSGGKVMLVGMGTPNYVLPISEASSREIDLVPTWRYADTYPEAIDIMEKVATGSIAPNIRKLVTHRVSGLESVEKAFKLAARPEDAEGKMVIKVVVNQ